jgi:hypothetical protein
METAFQYQRMHVLYASVQVFTAVSVPDCGLLDSDTLLSLVCDYEYWGTASTLRIVVGTHVPSKLYYSPISLHVITHTAQKASRCFVLGVFVPLGTPF